MYLLEIGYLSWHNTSFPLWMFLTTEAASHSLYKRNKNHAIEKKSFKHFVEKKNLQCIKLNSISHFKERTDQNLKWKNLKMMQKQIVQTIKFPKIPKTSRTSVNLVSILSDPSRNPLYSNWFCVRFVVKLKTEKDFSMLFFFFKFLCNSFYLRRNYFQ